MTRYFVALIVTVVATAVLLTLAGMADGMCHCMTSMYTLFPYGTMISMRTSWEFTGLVVTFIQFPVYVTILLILKSTESRVMALIAIIAIHVLAAVSG